MTIITAIGAWLPGLFGKQLSPRLTKALGTAILILAAILLLWLGKLAYDASLIAQHEAEQRAEIAEAQAAADRAADAATARREKELAEAQQALEQAADEAVRRDPEGAAQTVGPATQSYYDTLRAQEARR